MSLTGIVLLDRRRENIPLLFAWAWIVVNGGLVSDDRVVFLERLATAAVSPPWALGAASRLGWTNAAGTAEFCLAKICCSLTCLTAKPPTENRGAAAVGGFFLRV